MLQRGLHDTAGHLIALASVLKQLVDVKGREKEIFDCKEDHPHVCKCNYFLRKFEKKKEKMGGKIFHIGLCISWSFSPEGIKIFLNLNPGFTVWGHTLSHGKEKCPVIFYACLLLWSFFLGMVSPFHPEEFKAEKSSVVDRSLGSLWISNSWMKVTPNDLWMIHVQLNMFAQNAHQIILSNECRCRSLDVFAAFHDQK